MAPVSMLGSDGRGVAGARGLAVAGGITAGSVLFPHSGCAFVGIADEAQAGIHTHARGHGFGSLASTNDVCINLSQGSRPGMTNGYGSPDGNEHPGADF